MRALTLASILAAALAAGCYGTAGYDSGYGYTASVSNVGYGPDLVYVAPGVQVIADYDEPIFFMDGFYWRFYGNTWYRSSYYTGGWIYAAAPSALLRIDRPHTYVHYRPQGWTARRDVHRGPIVRDHRDERPIVRDHREDRPPPRPRAEPRRAPPAPPPARPERGERHRGLDRDHRDHR